MRTFNKHDNLTRTRNGFVHSTFILVSIILAFLRPAYGNNDLHSYVIQEVLPQVGRVKDFYWQGRKYWLKKTTKDKNLWFKQIGRQLGAIFIPITFLKPTPYGDKNPLQLEIDRLSRCAHLKLNCPRIIDSSEDWLVLSDSGISSEIYLQNLPQDQRVRFVLLLLETIFRNQERGFFHGRYYLRDMLVNAQGKISVFDFEEDPTLVMGVSDAKAKEIFYFLVSICAMMSDQETKQIGKWLKMRLDEETKESLFSLLHYEKVLKLLDSFKSLLGRDTERFLKATFFIKNNLR